MLETEKKDTLTEICGLILTAASKNALRKAVLSKCENKSIQKAVITLKQSREKIFLQAEYFHKELPEFQ